LNEVGWHAGSSAANAHSIGIEVCMNNKLAQDQAFKRAQALVACLCYDLDIDPSKAVHPHTHWSGKKCPSLLLDGGKLGAKWNSFIKGIADLLETIKDPPKSDQLVAARAAW
jgi:N-acetylmuramoyl-L-alanine amidase